MRKIEFGSGVRKNLYSLNYYHYYITYNILLYSVCLTEIIYIVNINDVPLNKTPEDVYWDWVHGVKPKLSQGFILKFKEKTKYLVNHNNHNDSIISSSSNDNTSSTTKPLCCIVI